MTEQQDNDTAKEVTIISEDGKEISPQKRKKIKKAVNWLNDWIERRHSSGKMTDEEYITAREKMDNLVIATQDGTYKNIDSNAGNDAELEGYFDYRDGEIIIAGKAYPNKNVVHINSDSPRMESLLIHETTHALCLEESEWVCTPSSYSDTYYDSSIEIYARIMQTRYELGLSPTEELTQKHIRYIRDKEKKHAKGESLHDVQRKALEDLKEENVNNYEKYGLKKEQVPNVIKNLNKKIFEWEKNSDVEPQRPKTLKIKKNMEYNNVLDNYSDEDLLDFFNLTADNNQYSNDSNQLYAQQTSPQDYEENVSTIMASGHSKIQDRIAAFRERRDKESIARAGIVESMRADNLRLQQRREMLAEMTGTRPSSPQYNFVDRHYNCEDVVARNQEQETPQTPVRQSFIGRLRDVFSSQRA